MQAPLSGVSALPTERHDLTAEGTILGTLQYMSPEQLEAKETDARTDIFAFGSGLYEMATGKKAFTGKSHASLISAILSSEPAPISTIQPLAPPALDRVVRTCMAKDPEDRWQTVHDVMLELKWISETASQTEVAAVGARKGNRLLWGIAAILLGVISAGLLFWAFLDDEDVEMQPLAFFPQWGKLHGRGSGNGTPFQKWKTDSSLQLSRVQKK